MQVGYSEKKKKKKKKKVEVEVISLHETFTAPAIFVNIFVDINVLTIAITSPKGKEVIFHLSHTFSAT